MLSFDYANLLGKIRQKCGSQVVFACKMNLSERSMSLKLNNKVDWKQREIFDACDILEIDTGDIPEYFFTPIVQN